MSDNRKLSPTTSRVPATPAPRKRPKVHRESPDMAEFVERVARAMVRRASEGDLEALSALADMREAADAAVGQAARGLHEAGYSWTQIAAETGTTRQNARQRWGSVD